MTSRRVVHVVLTSADRFLVVNALAARAEHSRMQARDYQLAGKFERAEEAQASSERYARLEKQIARLPDASPEELHVLDPRAFVP